jgi:hypothetical protein
MSMTDVHTTPGAQAPESEEKNTTTVKVEAQPSEPNVTASEAAAAEPKIDTQHADDAGETRKRSGTPYSQRIGELTREKYELKAELAEMRAKYGSGAPSPAPERAEHEQGPPKLDTYNSYEEWVEAVADYRAEKRFMELQQQSEERAAQDSERKAADSRRAAYEKAVASIEDRYPDYHDVTAEMPTTRMMAEFILEHDKGPDIAYYLGKHPDEAMRIANLSPVKQGFELAKLEAKLVTPGSQAKTASTAPEPINPVRPRERAPAADPSKMTMAEYANWRKQQMRAERNR